MSSSSNWETQAHKRWCAHCSRESQGKAYTGLDYLRVLQRLRGDEAMRLARKVEPFFWSDADMMSIRLCDECISHLGLDKAQK